MNTVVYPGGRTDPEILEVERNSTPEWFMQEYGADFASFVGKIFQGPDVAELRKRMATRFAQVNLVKPEASRSSSTELYLVGQIFA